MFCPKCGAEELNRVQFCRACGTELHMVRTALEQPDAITTSAITAREEIARVVANKIAEFESARDMERAVYDILPAIEKYLESPEERRMRKEQERLDLVRGGLITASVGLGLILFFLVLGFVIRHEELLIGCGAGGLVLLTGLGVLISGLISPERFGYSKKITEKRAAVETPTNPLHEELPSMQPPAHVSVTEGTTRQLRD